MIHNICKERGWNLEQFYERPLGEQESYIAFEIVQNYMNAIENIKSIRDMEKSSKKHKKEPSKADQQSMAERMNQIKSKHKRK